MGRTGVFHISTKPIYRGFWTVYTGFSTVSTWFSTFQLWNDVENLCKMLRQHRTIPALRLKHRSGGSPRQEPPQAAVALRSASLRLGVRHGICVAKMLDNVWLRYPHRASGAKAPRTLRPLPLLRFAVSATGGAHLCSIQYYLRFWLSSCRTSLAVSALRIMQYCLYLKNQGLPLRR